MSKLIEIYKGLKMLKIDRSKKFTDFFDSHEGDRTIDFLVLHHIEANSLEHAIEQLQEHKVSSHFIIDESGNIFELVDENDVSYHAGVSYWNGCESLNSKSIGIEFINSDAFGKKFEEKQMISGVALCKYLTAKYNIEPENVVGHSDIAYDKETGLLDRKQDPSHLFDWSFLAENGIGVFKGISKSVFTEEKLDGIKLGDKNEKIKSIKERLQRFGYKVVNLDDHFDPEMENLLKVFQRRFGDGNM